MSISGLYLAGFNVGLVPSSTSCLDLDGEGNAAVLSAVT